jgi:hypothetical protein
VAGERPRVVELTSANVPASKTSLHLGVLQTQELISAYRGGYIIAEFAGTPPVVFLAAATN